MSRSRTQEINSSGENKFFERSKQFTAAAVRKRTDAKRKLPYDEMPNTKSAIKAMRQNQRRRNRNLLVLETVRKATKQVRKATASGKKDDVNKALAGAFSALDKAAKKNVIHKNTASRKKARLAAMVTKSTK